MVGGEEEVDCSTVLGFDLGFGSGVDFDLPNPFFLEAMERLVMVPI